VPIVRKCREYSCAEKVVDCDYCPAHHKPSCEKEYSYFYSLAIWRSKWGMRRKKLSESPMCEKCGRVAATEVHHIVAHRGDWDKFVDYANLQSLCASCHAQETQRENFGKKL